VCGPGNESLHLGLLGLSDELAAVVRLWPTLALQSQMEE